MTASRLALRVLLTGVLVSAPALFTASAMPESACDILQRWAEPYRGTSPSLDELGPFDRAHRNAIFTVVSPAVRAALWREHLRRFARRPDLSEAQRALIVEAGPFLTAAFYDREPAAIRAFEDKLRRRIDAAFTGAHKRAWFDIGVFADASPSAFSWEVLTRPVRASAEYPWCDCNLLADDCWFGACLDPACNIRGLGCGFAMQYPCDAMCR